MSITHTSGRLAIALLESSLLALAALAVAQPQPTEDGFIHVEEDIRIYYERFGTDAPVLFIRNRHETHLTFAPLLEAYDVVTWDPRGRGLSDRPADLARYVIDAEHVWNEAHGLVIDEIMAFLDAQGEAGMVGAD